MEHFLGSPRGDPVLLPISSKAHFLSLFAAIRLRGAARGGKGRTERGAAGGGGWRWVEEEGKGGGRLRTGKEKRGQREEKVSGRRRKGNKKNADGGDGVGGRVRGIDFSVVNVAGQ